MWRWYRLKQVLQEEDGIGVVEIILILVVLIGLVLIFKSQLTRIKIISTTPIPSSSCKTCFNRYHLHIISAPFYIFILLLYPFFFHTIYILSIPTTAHAKRAGEEAGTKLLLPMFLMLAVVLVIVIVPAFLSVQL